MKKILLATILLSTGAMMMPAQAQAPACKKGQVTCMEWCRKYNPVSRNCINGPTNSCATMKHGGDTCVGDKPRGA